MDNAHLLDLLKHLDKQWKILAVTPDEIAELRALGYVEPDSAMLTDVGLQKMSEMILSPE